MGACAKRVFTSSKTYDGAQIVSVLAADAVCAQMAKDASLSGKWMAWISDSSGSSPAKRFDAPFPGPYVLAKNPSIRIVKNAAAFAKPLEHAIDLDETGAIVPAGTPVYTNTDGFGDAIPAGPVTGYACKDWTSNAMVDAAFTGIITSSNGWTFHAALPCTTLARIYCFEQ